MAPRIILRLLGVVLLGALLGAGGWYLWKLRRQAQATGHQLHETQQSLTHTQETLALTEEERRELLVAFEEQKARVAKTDHELAQLKGASAQMTTQLAALTSDRTKLTQQLDDVTQQTERLDEQLTALEAESAAVEAEKASLERQLHEVTSTSLSPAEVQQLTQTVAHAHGEAERLRAQMLALSRAYEHLALAPTPSASRRQASRRPSAAEQHRTAQRYRRLGDLYLATYQYPKAASAYEQALTHQDDPEVHTRLAFLYSRVLHDPQKAQRHMAPDRDPTSAALGTTPGAQGLPRKGWRLVWNWLTQ